MKSTWHCDPCPTASGGSCESSKWCPIANDGIETSAPCPSFVGCAKKSDCKSTEFCLSHSACVSELSTQECGAKGTGGGFCLSHVYCTAARALDGTCQEGCVSDSDCDRGEFCADYSECVALRGKAYCGRAPEGSSNGLCMPQEFCTRGLHSPVSGSCPASTKYDFGVTQSLQMSGSKQLAILHQAANVWRDPMIDGVGEERLVVQTHDYVDVNKRRDDKEFVEIYKVKVNKETELIRSIETSCPNVEITVPSTGPLRLRKQT